MPVLYPSDLRTRQASRARLERQRQRRSRGKRFVSMLLATLILIGVAGGLAYSRPVSAVPPSLVALQSEQIAPLNLPWPSKGQAAVGAVGFGVVDEHNTEKPKPIASTAKMVTALMVLQKKPLQSGQTGPDITFTANDEAIYRAYIAKGGSVYPVTAGETISERQALDALLVMSANNIADLLAVWAYGSMDAYTTAANQYLRSHNITTMTMSDASGFSPKTVATAADLVQVGELIMQDALLSEVVAQKSISIPGVGEVSSTNVILGNGVVGIKTGNTDEAGGCFVIAVKHEVAGQAVLIVAAVTGAEDVRTAITQAQRIALDARSGFAEHEVVPKGAVVAEYQVPWGESIRAVTASSLRAVSWLPSQPKPETHLDSISAGKAVGQTVGTVTVSGGASVDVVLDGGLVSPPLTWRLYRRYL